MKVTVIDREAMRKAWGTGLYEIITRTIEISDSCPVCQGPRGTPKASRVYEDGCTAWPHVWTNECGHVDEYKNVIAEAEQNAIDKINERR